MTDRFDTSDAETEPEWMRRKAFVDGDADGRAQLIRLLDEAAMVNCDLVIYEHNEPLAEAALRTWAGARDLPVQERDTGIGTHVRIWVEHRPDRDISIYRRGKP